MAAIFVWPAVQNAKYARLLGSVNTTPAPTPKATCKKPQPPKRKKQKTKRKRKYWIRSVRNWRSGAFMNQTYNGYTIYTIGHGNRKIDDFIYLLKKYEIELLVDVRTYPYSRFHTQFRQAVLDSSLDAADINYLFLGEELGGRPKDPALHINGRVNYTAVKQTPLFRSGIEQVENLAKQ